jgi:hypothetical protein
MEHAAGDAPQWALALQDSTLGQTMRQSLLLYPVVEIVHLLSIATLVGSILALDLRLMGVRRMLPARLLARHLLTMSLVGFCGAVLSGSMLFATEAASLYFNPAFRLKMFLILLAGINAAVFHLGPWRGVAAWEQGVRPPAAARIGGAASMALWIGVLCCGRLIAYL